MAKTLGLFPGTFDPITIGHVGIVRRALRLFDRVVVAVTLNLAKRPLFSAEERMGLVRACFDGERRLEVDRLDGLLADYAQRLGATAIVRGLRAPSDFEYELRMAQMNHHLNPELETVFLAAEANGSYVSSSLVREVAILGGDVSALVPAPVYAALSAKLSG